MLGNEESSIASVSTPANAGETEWPIGQLRHNITQEITQTTLRSDGDLMLSDRNRLRPLLAWQGWLPIAVSWMLITHLQLVVVLIRLHEEALLNVEKNREVLVKLHFLWCHFDMGKCPGRGTELVLEIEELVGIGTGAEDCAVSTVLLAISSLSTKDIGSRIDEADDSSFRGSCDVLDAEPLSLVVARHHSLAGMNPTGTLLLPEASVIGEVTGQDALGHCLAEVLGGCELDRTGLDLLLLDPLIGFWGRSRNNVAGVVIVWLEDWVVQPALSSEV